MSIDPKYFESNRYTGGNKSPAKSHALKKSTRTHFKGVGTKVEKDKKGTHGYYHGTNVASKDPKGHLHFRTGGYLTNTTVRRMQAFAREHGGKSIALSRAKGTLSGTDHSTGKKLRSGYKNGEHRMTVK